MIQSMEGQMQQFLDSSEGSADVTADKRIGEGAGSEIGDPFHLGLFRKLKQKFLHLLGKNAKSMWIF